MMTKRALLYARVSTSNQEENSSLDNQIDNVRQYALEQGYLVVAEAREVISGTFIFARTKFNQFAQMIANGEADVVIVDLPDRLGRGEAISNCEFYIKLNGGSIEYTRQKHDRRTKAGRILSAIDGVLSGEELEDIRRRTMDGKQKFARNGRIIASRFRPYGYDFHRTRDEKTGKMIDCKLVIVDEEKEVVRQIFEWCAYEGLTTHGIAKRLTQMGVLTMSDKEGGHGKKVGSGVWHRSTLAGMLSNTTYKGEWRYRKNKSRKLDSPGKKKTSREKYAEEDQIGVLVPAIVSSELWELAQKKLKENRQRCHKPTKHKYLLRGRVKCGNCGGSMSGMTQKSNGRQYYRCCTRYRQSGISEQLCKARSVDAATIESRLWQFVSSLLTNEDLLFSKIENQRKESEQTTMLLQVDLARLQTENQKDVNAIDRFLDGYGDGTLTKEQYRSKRQERESRIEQRQEKILEREQQLRTASPLPTERESALKLLRQKVGRRIEAATFEQKKDLYSLLQIECTYNDATGRVVVTGVFGSHSLELKAKKANNEVIDRSLQLTRRF